MENSKEVYPQKMLCGISSNNFILEGVLTEEAFNLDPVRMMAFAKYQLHGMIIKKLSML